MQYFRLNLIDRLQLYRILRPFIITDRPDCGQSALVLCCSFSPNSRDNILHFVTLVLVHFTAKLIICCHLRVPHLRLILNRCQFDVSTHLLSIDKGRQTTWSDMSDYKVLFDSTDLLLPEIGHRHTVNHSNNPNLSINLLTNLPPLILTLLYFSLHTVSHHQIQPLSLQQLQLVVSAISPLPEILEKGILFSRYNYNLFLFNRHLLYLYHWLLLFWRILFRNWHFSHTGRFLWISLII